MKCTTSVMCLFVGIDLMAATAFYMFERMDTARRRLTVMVLSLIYHTMPLAGVIINSQVRTLERLINLQSLSVLAAAHAAINPDAAVANYHRGCCRCAHDDVRRPPLCALIRRSIDLPTRLSLTPSSIPSPNSVSIGRRLCVWSRISSHVSAGTFSRGRSRRSSPPGGMTWGISSVPSLSILFLLSPLARSSR